MATPEQMTATVDAYIEAFDIGDPELAVALFAEDACIEDPIGTPLMIGHDAIREFYIGAVAAGAKLVLEGPIRVVGDYAAFPFSAQLVMGGNGMRIDGIDIFKFNDAGKVIEMKAFHGPGNMHAI